MMAPTIILEPDGSVTALGTGGSNRIRTAILQVAVNLLDHGMSLEDAVHGAAAASREMRNVELRAWCPTTARGGFRALEDKAHAWPEVNLFFGGVHAARRLCQWRCRGRRRPAPRRAVVDKPGMSLNEDA